MKDKVKDYKGIQRTMISLTRITTVVGKIDGITDDSSKETIHRVRIPILTEINRPLHALCATWSKRVAYHNHT